MQKLRKLKELFFETFRSPKDIHRVISALFLSVTFSHIYFIIIESPKISIPNIEADTVLVGLVSGVLIFQVLWTFLSSELNIKLYIRQFVVIGWGVLAHRLSYGVESFGTQFVTIMLLTGWSIWIPFALSGMRFDELIKKIEVWQDGKKNNALIRREHGIHNIAVHDSNGERSVIRPN